MMCYSTNGHSGKKVKCEASFFLGKSQVKGYSWGVGENEDQGKKDQKQEFLKPRSILEVGQLL